MLIDEILGRNDDDVDADLSRDPPPGQMGGAFPKGQDFEYLASAGAPAGAPTIGGTGVFGTDTVTTPGSGLVFVNTYGAGVTTGFHNAIVAAETYLESHFTNSITIHANFDLQALNHAFSGQNSFGGVGATYQQIVSALQAHATSPDDFAAVSKLQGMADPSGGQLYFVPNAQAKLLGLPGTSNGTDDTIILNNFYWNDTSINANMGDAVGVLMHELTEGGMGRIGGQWAMMDLFRYTAAGQLDDTGGQDGLHTYFSPNGQNINTGLQFHNPINAQGQDDGFDWADWDQVGQDANAHDPFGPGGPGAGDPGTLSATDLQIMDVLGWTKPGAAPPANPAVKNDFNGDNNADILWQNNSGGVFLNLMSGSQVLSSMSLGGGGPSGMTIVGSGDFNGDHNADLLWKDNTGAVTMKEMSGGQTLTSAALGGGGSAGWAVVGTGDFNGDGNTDILWQNSAGVVMMNEMNGTQVLASFGLGGDASWSIAGTGDFNGDSKADILWLNSSGVVVMNQMNGSQVLASAALGGGGPAGWAVTGVGDFNGDGKTDILWQGSSGLVVMSQMNGTQVTTSAVLGGGGSAGWSIAGTGDFNGDAMADILWKNSSGQVVMNQMSGSQVLASAGLGGGGSAGWTIAHT